MGADVLGLSYMKVGKPNALLSKLSASTRLLQIRNIQETTFIAMFFGVFGMKRN